MKWDYLQFACYGILLVLLAFLLWAAGEQACATSLLFLPASIIGLCATDSRGLRIWQSPDKPRRKSPATHVSFASGTCSPAGIAYRDNQRLALVSLLRQIRTLHPAETLWRIWLQTSNGIRLSPSVVIGDDGQRRVIVVALPTSKAEATSAQLGIALLAFEYADAAFIAANAVRDSLANLSLQQFGTVEITLHVSECAPKSRAKRYKLALAFPN